MNFKLFGVNLGKMSFGISSFAYSGVIRENMVREIMSPEPGPRSWNLTLDSRPKARDLIFVAPHMLP